MTPILLDDLLGLLKYDHWPPGKIRKIEIEIIHKFEKSVMGWAILNMVSQKETAVAFHVHEVERWWSCIRTDCYSRWEDEGTCTPPHRLSEGATLEENVGLIMKWIQLNSRLRAHSHIHTLVIFQTGNSLRIWNNVETLVILFKELGAYFQILHFLCILDIMYFGTELDY